MPHIARLLQRWPRIGAAVAFGAAGLVLAGLWYLPLTVRGSHPVLHSLLFVALPGISGAISGAALGKPLSHPGPARGALAAGLRGAIIATVALLLFAPLFATLFTLSEPGGSSSVLGLTSLLLAGSAFAAWLPAAALGAGVGWLLFTLSRGAETPSAPPGVTSGP